MKPLGIPIIVAGVVLLAFDIYMSLAWSGFLVPQMVLALVALGMILGGTFLQRRTPKRQGLSRRYTKPVKTPH